MTSELVYHQATVALFDPVPSVSPAALALIEERERELGIRLPASVREWYSLDGAASLLATYSNDDHPIPLETLGDTDWQDDLVADGLLVVLHENQNVCRWAVPLEETNDPPVLVQDDRKRGWRMVAERFSAFIYSFVWNYREIHYAACMLEAKAMPVSTDEIASLRDQFAEAQHIREWLWHGDMKQQVSYRFSTGDGDARILIENVIDQEATWHLAADSLLALGDLVTRLWNQGSFIGGADLRMHCQPGLDASWHLWDDSSPQTPQALGQLTARLATSGELSLGMGPFASDGEVIRGGRRQARIRSFACVSDDPEDAWMPQAPKVRINRGDAVSVFSSFPRQRGRATEA